jgi:hypothetical protein
MINMRLRALLSQICLVAILLIAAAISSAAWAHESHEHAAGHAAIASGPLHKGTPAEVSANPGESQSVAMSQPTTMPDTPCNGACCGSGCCGSGCCSGCTMALAEDVSQVPPLILVGTRILLPGSWGGPGTIPEALPKPPKSFA